MAQGRQACANVGYAGGVQVGRDLVSLIQAAEIQAGTPLLAEVKRQLEDLEGAYRANTTYPIRDLLRDEAPHPALKQIRRRLNDIYAGELGEPFTTAGLCLYRDGGDSVAWHGDDSGRGSTADTMVAIVSLGSPRTLALRPRGGGRRVAFSLGHGDLLVMGGSCQRTWEHAVPKTARSVGPRISVQFRPRGVR